MNEQLLPKIEVNIKYLHPVWEEHNLSYATDHSIGLDLRACINEENVILSPGERFAFPSGVAIEVCTAGVAGFVFSRSGLGTKDGLTVSQGVGVIDPDYRGEIVVSLLNTSCEERVVVRGQRIAQLVFLHVFQASLTPVSVLGETARGCGGFGHTGRH